MRLHVVNFVEKSWSKSFNNQLGYDRIVFQCICPTITRQLTQLFKELFAEVTKAEMPTRCRKFGKFPPSNAPISEWLQFYNLEPSLLLFVSDYVKAKNKLFQKKHNQSESCTIV